MVQIQVTHFLIQVTHASTTVSLYVGISAQHTQSNQRKVLDTDTKH